MPSSASLEVSFREQLPLSLPLAMDVLVVRCCFSVKWSQEPACELLMNVHYNYAIVLRVLKCLGLLLLITWLQNLA